MTKVKGFFIALFLVVLTFFVAGTLADHRIAEIPTRFMRNLGSDEKFAIPSNMTRVIDEGTMVLMGSSEFASDTGAASYPFNLFQVKTFNLLKVGQGGYQSLVHAGILGAIGESVSSRKVALILSPQWFSQKGIDPAILPAKLSMSTIDAFFGNEKLSQRTKEQFYSRVVEVTEGVSAYRDNVTSVYGSAQQGGAVDRAKTKILLAKESWKNKLRMLYTTRAVDFTRWAREETPESVPPINFVKMRKEAEENAASKVTNNDFYVDDHYFKTYVEGKYDLVKESSVGALDPGSPEYDDLQLFLDIAREQGLEVLLINFPLHGKWMDEIGFSKEKRENYQQRIAEIAKNHDVSLLDLSDQAYEPYFLKDLVHIGEKGWVSVDEGLLEFKEK